MNLKTIISSGLALAALVSCTREEDRISQSNQSNPFPAEIATSTAATSIAVTSITDVNTNPAPEITTKTNAEYILEVAKGDKDLSPLLLPNTLLAEHISKRLRELEHLNPTPEGDDYYTERIEYVNTPDSDYLTRESTQTLVRIYYLLQALSTPEIRGRIGSELELDTQDRSGEHGGLFHLTRNGLVYVEMLPNVFNCGQMIEFGAGHCDPDYHYSPGESKSTLDGLVSFHFHAQKVNYMKSSTLSLNDFWGGGAVITRIDKKRFNVDIGLYPKTDDSSKLINLDLGTYEY